ncbi:hypothetical protein [Deinococcus sp. JMULE3]|uniref:hypothetical protein n=1 Tax=Deinococcus sp. JMULE3 TaxID=2518341 RepID=UPI001575B62F|nr:hypothetical protein [Deinococcus sp. JMULE3]NTY01344.1 hypothetical protein [Deinococcus sp. JMULE3]
MTRSLPARLGLTPYGLHCMNVSLRKRWWQPTLTLGLITLGLLAAQTHLRPALLLTVLAAALHATWIALYSAYRHRHDLPLHTPDFQSHPGAAAR